LIALKLLADLRERGLRATADGADLVIRGPRGALTADLAAMIRAQKAELLMLLEAEGASEAPAFAPSIVPVPQEIRCRVTAFRHQYAKWATSGRWAIPTFALPGVHASGSGLCFSCGERTFSKWRCGLCLGAIQIVLSELDQDAEVGP
jgi:hypothetical protein